MKNFLSMKSIKALCLPLALLLAHGGFSQNQITMTMSDPVNITATSFEFDINVANTGTSTLKLSAGQPQIQQTGTGIPTGTAPSYTLVYEGPVFANLNNPTLAYNNNSFRITQSPIGTNASAITIPTFATVEYHVKVQSTAGNITYPVTMKLRTTTPNITLSAYVDVSGTTTTFSLVAGNLILGPDMVVSAPLPVELEGIEAVAKGTGNVVRWATASEANSQYHIVERSADGSGGWSEVGRRQAAGTTQGRQAYQLTDERPLALSYYRLRMVDYDGRFEYSKVVSVERKVDQFAVTNVYPTPASREVELQVALPAAAALTVTVTDLSGRTMEVRELDAPEGASSFSLDLSGYATGTYVVKISDGLKELTQRIVKQ